MGWRKALGPTHRVATTCTASARAGTILPSTLCWSSSVWAFVWVLCSHYCLCPNRPEEFWRVVRSTLVLCVPICLYFYLEPLGVWDVCMHACMHVCISGCMNVCMDACMYVCMHVGGCRCMNVWMGVCLCTIHRVISLYPSIFGYTHFWIYTYTHIYYMYGHVYIYTYIYYI